MRGYGNVRAVVLRFPVKLLEELDRDLAARRVYRWDPLDRSRFLLGLVAGELGVDIREAKPLTAKELADVDARRLERRRDRARARAPKG